MNPDSVAQQAAPDSSGQRLLLWIAALAAVFVGLLPPLLLVYISYQNLSERVQTVANVQAVLLSRYAGVNPDNWMYKTEHIAVLLKGVHDESMYTEIQHHAGTVLELGTRPVEPSLLRQAEFSAFGTVEGRVLVRTSATDLRSTLLFGLMTGLAGAGLLLWLLKRFVLDRLHSAELLRRAVEDRLKDLVALSSDWFWEQDAAYRFTFNSMSAPDVLDSGPLIGKCLWDQTTNLTPRQWAEHRAELEARRDFVLRYAIPRADGAQFWAEIRGKARFDAQGAFVGYRGVGTDITRRKLDEIEMRLAATAFETQACILIADEKNTILRVNQAFTDVTGYTEAEAVGQTPRLLRSSRHAADFFREMWATILRTGQWQGEVWNRRKNGEEYLAWLTITTVKSDDGATIQYVGTQYDITDQNRAQKRIEELAFFDPLTSLPNRTLLLDRLKQAMAVASRNGTYSAVLFIDLDNFKTLNDTQGHDRGDLLLQQVAMRLTGCLRDGDTVARFGGDEFVVVLSNLSRVAAEAAAQTEMVGDKILSSLEQVYQLGEVQHQCTASIGVTLTCAGNTTVDDLLKQADLAMYSAKDAGRNCMHFFDATMQAAVLERVMMEGDLNRALEEEQFLLHYQAQVAGVHSTVKGAEVLVRWQHPLRGMVSPADFIPLAEETGLILPLGEWILETACCQLTRWSSQPDMAHLTLAVNVSAVQFRQADFVSQVLKVLQRTGANAQRLKLELTESLLVENVQEVVEKMSALKAVGVSFSLDDFGTGYSSLAYLKRLPLDQLKIDQGFVRNIVTDPNDAAIARMVVVLSESMGLAVIAEGVELQAQADLLAYQGCHAYQGYLFSKPLPIEGFEAFVQRCQ